MAFLNRYPYFNENASLVMEEADYAIMIFISGLAIGVVGLAAILTAFYIFWVWKDEDLWDTSEDHPIDVESTLGDIMHCPGKPWSDGLQVLYKQLDRSSVSAYDVGSGTGQSWPRVNAFILLQRKSSST